MALLLTVIVIALLFEFINGFHDTANSVAAVVGTRVLTPTQAILLAAESRAKSGEIFFLSDGTDYLMREVGDVFARTMGVTPLSVPIPKWLLFGFASFSEYFSLLSRKPSLISRGMAEQMVEKDWTCDITKAKTTLGFQPRFQLSEGAKLTYQWYKNQHWL